jgi:soluble lytic murein transglycosylase-like protein
MSAATGIKAGHKRGVPQAFRRALAALVLGALPLLIIGDARPAAAATRDAGLPEPSREAIDLRLNSLSAADIARYQAIFDAQRDQKWAEADRHIRLLQDRLLLGHVLAQRFSQDGNAAYKTSYRELADWLKNYGDHPGADVIYKKALAAKPRAESPPPAPIGADAGDFAGEALTPNILRAGPTVRKRTAAEKRTIELAEAAMQRHLAQGKLELAERVLDRADIQQAYSASEFDAWRRRIASQYFIAGNDQKALILAAAAARRSRAEVPTADWVAGLAAWRLARYDNAAHHFEQLAHSETATTWDTSAGAYWAARVMLKLRQPREFTRMLEEAARYPRTFYGLIAHRQLGRDLPLAWDAPALKPDDAQRLAAMPVVRRAVALSDLGQTVLAERELRRLNLKGRDQLASALLGLAGRLDTPATFLHLGLTWRDATGEHIDAALYPLPPWEPETGFSVDRALVFAFMRQESAFNPRALSPAGASGLMQLMPRTASFVAGDGALRRKDRHRLFAPEYNIELGQRYLQHLLDNPLVKGNVLYLAAAYNAGPGNLQKWMRELRFDEDPLLFTELIPMAETRNFVERVVTNLWIYRARLGLASPSLDAMTVGNWPLYDGGDQPGPAIAPLEGVANRAGN